MEYLITKDDMRYYCSTDILEHHGIKGQKWGVRRYQNPDGSLTNEGKKRYGNNPELYKKDLAATKARESAVAGLEARKQAIKTTSKQYRMDAKTLNNNRNKAVRAVSAVLGGPFINTLYADFLSTSSSRNIAIGESIIAGFAGASTLGLSNYAIQRYRQNSRAAKEYDRKNKGPSAKELQDRKTKAELDFNRK